MSFPGFFASTFSTESVSTNFPSRMIPTLSQIFSTRFIMCVLMMMLFPRARKSKRNPSLSAVMIPNHWSARQNDDSWTFTSEMAIDVFCCMPLKADFHFRKPIDSEFFKRNLFLRADISNQFHKGREIIEKVIGREHLFQFQIIGQKGYFFLMLTVFDAYSFYKTPRIGLD